MNITIPIFWDKHIFHYIPKKDPGSFSLLKIQKLLDFYVYKLALEQNLVTSLYLRKTIDVI